MPKRTNQQAFGAESFKYSKRARYSSNSNYKRQFYRKRGYWRPPAEDGSVRPIRVPRGGMKLFNKDVTICTFQAPDVALSCKTNGSNEIAMQFVSKKYAPFILDAGLHGVFDQWKCIKEEWTFYMDIAADYEQPGISQMVGWFCYDDDGNGKVASYGNIQRDEGARIILFKPGDMYKKVLYPRYQATTAASGTVATPVSYTLPNDVWFDVSELNSTSAPSSRNRFLGAIEGTSGKTIRFMRRATFAFRGMRKGMTYGPS